MIGAYAHTARHAVKCAEWRRTQDVAWRRRRGRAGQAFELGEPGVMDGATANSSPQTATGRDRMTRPSRRSSSRRSCLRILDQGLGPTRARSSRNRPLEPLCTMARLAQGWAGHPCPHAECRSLQREHPLRTLTRRAWSRAGRVGNARFASHRSLLCEDALPVVPQPIEQDPGHGAVPFRDGRPFS